MMLTSRPFFLLFLFACSGGSDERQETDASEVKNGTYIEYHDNDTIRSKRLYKDNEMIKWESWYSSGIKEREATYSGGREVDTTKEWYEDGVVKSVSIYVNDSTHSVQRYHRNGALKASGKLMNSIPYGMWVVYYENGKRKSEGAYLPCRYFDHESASPSSSYCSNGEWTYWYENGQRKATGAYLILENGTVKIGEWREWHENGNPHKIEHYNDSLNQLHGHSKWWYPDKGFLGQSGHYVHGKKHGDWIMVDEYSREKFIETYQNDSLVKTSRSL